MESLMLLKTAKIMINKAILTSVLGLLTAGFATIAYAQPAPTTGHARGDTVDAARKFLALLDDGQRAKVLFDYKDNAQRQRWSNFPSGIFQRAGLSMGEPTQPQRDAARAV